MDRLVGQNAIRRKPKQERSRERVDHILAVSKTLIGAKGVDAVTMREIAAATGGPIASLYQYFPNKSAIIATIYMQFVASIEEALGRMISGIGASGDPLSIAHGVFDLYYQAIRSDPATLDVLLALQADKTLMAIDIATSRRLAALFCSVARPFVDPDRHEAFERVSTLLFHLSHSAVRMAMHLGGEDERRVIGDFKAVIDGQWQAFARRYPPR